MISYNVSRNKDKSAPSHMSMFPMFMTSMPSRSSICNFFRRAVISYSLSRERIRLRGDHRNSADAVVSPDLWRNPINTSTIGGQAAELVSLGARTSNRRTSITGKFVFFCYVTSDDDIGLENMAVKNKTRWSCETCVIFSKTYPVGGWYCGPVIHGNDSRDFPGLFASMIP